LSSPILQLQTYAQTQCSTAWIWFRTTPPLLLVPRSNLPPRKVASENKRELCLNLASWHFSQHSPIGWLSRQPIVGQFSHGLSVYFGTIAFPPQERNLFGLQGMSLSCKNYQ
jgi:hypothetical protein